MIKLICADCDGTLINAKQIHYESLNAAIYEVAKSYVIGYEDHLENFDGKPSRVKLAMLNKRGLDQNLNDRIWELKQGYTTHFIKELIHKEDYVNQVECIKRLNRDGYELACASNSISKTLNLMLECAGYTPYLHYIISNEEVTNSKPSPEIFLRTMIRFNRGPSECLIIEDSDVGCESAIKSGSFLMKVESPNDIQYDRIKMYTNFIDNNI